ncbi:glutamate ABC transporter substrate-binding protein [Rhodococcus maanshanensis]|uniref:Polar amino acid transport system substrate-binding protein n=1 Tax=Rhodococcus maanshanensis TaxID=183556 RepID=A0A1H7RMH0_9NOCA|nr:glutamate ABC transporter substrate-binding protein [Rhodococcus maanshanensis]SEL60567.1 polar amino acid transport system substrate-binding protein [Rhodococcus maanshanensis]
MSGRGTGHQPHLVALLLAAGVLLAATGCSYGSPDGSPTATPTFGPPLPGGAQVLEPVGGAPSSEPAPTSCDATASLRPGPPTTPGSMPPGGPLARIAERGRLIVATDQSTNLFSFRDPDSGQIAGFDVDVAKEIARDLFGDPSKVEFQIRDTVDREPALRAGSVDLIVNAMTITCDRAERIAFSTVYLQAAQRILVTEGSGIGGVADLAGKRVCTVPNTTSLANLQRLQPAATVLATETWADCLVALQQRQVDAATTDDALLAGLAEQDPYLEIVGGSLEPEPYGIGINSADQELVRFVNGTLDRMRSDGTWARLYDRWLSVLGPAPTPPEPRYRD